MLKAMSVRGALSTMPAEDILSWAARRQLSGPVTFERRGLVRGLMLEDGKIVWASSNRRDEQLGMILIRSGLVAERALADALETRAETGVALGKVLLMSGLITEFDLVEILATKIREAVTDVVTWTDGTFDVVPRESAATGVAAQLPIEVCLASARRRAPRMLEVMSVLGADDVTFYVPPAAAPPPAPEDGALLDTTRVWELAGDRLTAADIAASFGGERHGVFDALARMVLGGHLVVDRRKRERTNSAIELAAGARGRLRQGDRAGALAMVTQALHQDPNDAEVRKAFATIERARVAEVARRLLARHHVPRHAPGAPALTAERAAELGLTETEIELAGRVDGCWDLLSLVRSAPVREAEALLGFARLAEVGVVELG